MEGIDKMKYYINQTKKIIKIIFLLNLIANSLHAEGKPKDHVMWSPFQGKKTWQEAKDHCQSLKMRLPNISDLKLAEEAGTTKGWRKYGTRFWAVNKNDTSTYKVISILEKDKDNLEEIHKVESSVGVFCANVTEESITSDSLREKHEELSLKYSEYYSKYQGEMKWDDANEKCKSLKMRLPTIDELKEGAGITESWKKDTPHYWSSTRFHMESFYVFYPDGFTDGYYRYHSSGVRCRR